MRRQPRLAAAVLLLATPLLACARGQQPGQPEKSISLSVADILGGAAEPGRTGYARAVEPRPFHFPADHGPHPDFRSEWWYFVGNLSTDRGNKDRADSRAFGFQLTFFRFAVAPEEPEGTSAWRTRQVWMAHFALTDVAGRRFHAFERFARGALGLAGAACDGTGEETPEPPCRVGVGDWTAVGTLPGDLFPVRLTAAQEAEGQEGEDGEVAVDLVLTPEKAPVLQGEEGLSQKSPQPGNASYYYSLTRLAARGTVRLGGESFPVSGEAWMDREWSTSALSPEDAGWDWFAVQLANGRELMLYRIRRRDGGAVSASEATLVEADGTARRIPFEGVELTVLERWESPASGVVYPARWRLAIPVEGLDLTLTPRLPEQELNLSFRYWEGAVKVSGTSSKVSGTSGGRPVSGQGYVELTGYGED